MDINYEREWELDDLKRLGKKSGVTYSKAIPVLILEEWERKGRKKGGAFIVRNKDLANRLVNSGLHPRFEGRDASQITAPLTTIQDTNHLYPFLIEEVEVKGYKKGFKKYGLPHYEKLLYDYLQYYCKEYAEDYRKLFPTGGFEEKPPSLPKESAEPEEAEIELIAPEMQYDISSLFVPLEQALRNQQLTIKRLTEEKQKLCVEVNTLRDALEQGHGVSHRSIEDEELRNDCSKQLENKDTYIDAIRRANVVLEERLKRAVNDPKVEKLQYGASLVKHALAPDTGKLVIRDTFGEQDGVFQLFSGAFAFIRNPPAHKKVQYTEIEVWQIINLIDYLLGLLQQAKLRESRS